MFEKFLEGSRYYQFPSFEVAVYSVLLALVLSTAIAFTYKFTYKGKAFPNGFFQAMILSAVATSTIMMAVGNNLAVGFGIIGVIAIIRFRIQFQNTRNIVFIFAAISTGVASGAYGYAIAVAGTMIFCLVAILLHYSSFQQPSGQKVKIDLVLGEGQLLNDAEKTLQNLVDNLELLEIRTRENGTKYDYIAELRDGVIWEEAYQRLAALVMEVRIQQWETEERL